MSELIKGTYLPNDKKNGFDFIKEYESYQACLGDIKKSLIDVEIGKYPRDCARINVILKELERQVKGRESDILPLWFSFGYMSSSGWFVLGKTPSNDQVAMETHFSSYWGDISENITRFSVFDPDVDLRKVFSDFSKDKKYETEHFKPNSHLDAIVGKYRIGCVETYYGLTGKDWHIKQDHPLAVEAYNNTRSEIEKINKG